MPVKRNRKRSDRRVIRAVVSTPWAILPDKLHAICELLAERTAGRRFTKAEIAARLGQGPQMREPQSVGTVRILPLFGTLIPRASMLHEISGATSAERFLRAFQEAVADDNVSAIVLDVNSPGGSVHGIDELSQAIYDARSKKRIIAVANHVAASAAYYVATSAEEFVATPSSEVGSIGVFLLHEDWSEAYRQMGIKPTLISAGRFKTEGNSYEPLGEEAKGAMQARVDEFYAKFVGAVARNRGVSTERVTSGFGQGRVVSAETAVREGMADRVATLDDVIRELGATRVSVGLSSADVGRPVGQRTAAAASLVSEVSDMDKKIFAALVKAGLIDLSASDERAQQVLDAVLVITPPAGKSVEEIVAAVDRHHAAKIAAVAAPLQPQQQAAHSGQAVAVATPPAAGSGDSLSVQDLNAMLRMSRVEPSEWPNVMQGLSASGQPITHDRAYRAIMDHVTTRQAVPGPSITVTRESRDAFYAEARGAILSRLWNGNNPQQIFDRRSDDYVAFTPSRSRGLMSMRGLARECLIRAGANPAKVANLSDHQAAKAAMGLLSSYDMEAVGIQASSDGPAYNTTGMFPQIMLDATNVAARRSYDEVNTTFQAWMGRGADVTDFKPQNKIISGELSDVKAIPEDGEFSETSMTDSKESYKLEVWGQVFSLTWQAVINDQLGEFMKIPMKMGAAMRRKQNKLAYQVLKDNPTLSDTGALFNTTAVTTAGGHANLVTAGAAPSVATLNVGYQKMAEQVGLATTDGTVLNLEPRFIIAPPALRGTIMELLGSTANPASSNAGVVNIWQNALTPVFDAQLGSSQGGSDVWWFLAADAMQIDTIEYAYLQGLEAPALESATAFDRLAIRYRIYQAFAVKAIDYRGLFENDGS